MKHLAVLVASFCVSTAAFGDGFAPGNTPISSTANALPTIVTALALTCPASGTVIVSGSGESAALSSSAGPAFIGLAYSIARDSLATDNGNVVQSSALAAFSGDANRDFLNVQRVDSCTPGTMYTYRLTAYRTTPDTAPGSFVWNGRLTANEPKSVPGTGFAAGTTLVDSAANATPTTLSTLTVTCPASGALLVSGSGESAALSTNPNMAFVGLAYSVARNGTATDNSNVVQSSALALFNGDANRDFLNVQRVDSCTPGATSTYGLTVYRTTPDTSASSFVWNGRLTASEPVSLPGAGFAGGTTPIGSADNATPTIVTTLTVTCPASGTVLVSGSGESTAVSTNPSTAFIGLAYSIARDSVATDNSNVVQSSALAMFNGDANRDFLNVQRVDSCSPGLSSTYRLTAYRTTPDTSAGSFVWNGRLAAVPALGSNGGLPAPSGCTLSANALSLPMGGGGPITLTAACSGPVVPDSYAWSATGTNSGVVSPTLAGIQTVQLVTATSTFSVIPSTAGVPGNTASVTINVAPGGILCSGFAHTKVLEAAFPVNGGATTRYYTYLGIFAQGGAGWGQDDAIVVRFVAPPADQYMGINVFATFATISRTMNLSTNACEFSQTADSVLFAETGELNQILSTAPSPYTRYQLVPGTTYFLNLANRAGGANTCSDPNCEATILFWNPLP